MDIDHAVSNTFRQHSRLCYNCKQEGHITHNCAARLVQNLQFRAMMAVLLKEEKQDFLADQE